MSKYKVIKGSDSAHCCFEYTVVDTYRLDEFNHKPITVCECFEENDANLIAIALNFHWEKEEEMR